MSAPVVHFEIGAPDAGENARFYEAVFDWRFAAAGAAQLIVAGNEGGPTGMLNALGHPPHSYVTVYIQVGDIVAALERVAAAGGQCVVPPQPLPDGRKFAWISDPAGNVIGLLTKLV